MHLLLVAALLLPAAPEPGGEPVVMVEPRGQRGPPVAAVVVSPDGLVVAPLSAVGKRRRVTVYVSPQEQRQGAVLYRDQDAELALLSVGSIPGARVLKLGDGTPPARGTVLTVRGVEGGLPWQSGKATVVSTTAGPWGNLANGYITADGESDATGNDAGAAIIGPDGTLVGVHLGRLRVDGVKGNRFVAAGVERLRLFLSQATQELPVSRLCVAANAPHAQVTIDKVNYGEAPLVVKDLLGGWHTVRVDAPGHLPQERLLATSLEERACERFELEMGGSITFTTAAQQPLVSIDGAPYLPMLPEPLVLAEGPHVITVVARGWRPFTWSGDVASGEVRVVPLAMEREHGLFSINSQPEGAEVFVQGKRAGVTPLQGLKLAPGTWEVELKLPRYRPQSAGNVTVTDGGTVELETVKLTPMPARLTLAEGLLERGDEVFLNGRRVSGSTWRVEPGYHDVEVRRSWHTPGKIRLLLQPEEDRVVAPRPEMLPEAKERRMKIGLGVAGVSATLLLAAATVGLGASTVLLFIGSKVAYDDYHLQTQRADLDRTYWTSNGLLWGGLAAGAIATLTILTAVATVGGGAWALLTLPSEPKIDPQAGAK